MAQDKQRCALALSVGECPDGFCVVLTLSEDGHEDRVIEGGRRYESPEIARDEGAVLLTHLQNIFGGGVDLGLN